MKYLFLLLLLTGCGQSSNEGDKRSYTPYKCVISTVADYYPYLYDGNKIEGRARIETGIDSDGDTCLAIQVVNVFQCTEKVVGKVINNELKDGVNYLDITLPNAGCLFFKDFKLIYSSGVYFYDDHFISFSVE